MVSKSEEGSTLEVTMATGSTQHDDDDSDDSSSSMLYDQVNDNQDSGL